MTVLSEMTYYRHLLFKKLFLILIQFHYSLLQIKRTIIIFYLISKWSFLIYLCKFLQSLKINLLTKPIGNNYKSIIRQIEFEQKLHSTRSNKFQVIKQYRFKQLSFQKQKKMYNMHLATKVKKQLKKQRLSHMKQHQYLQKYTDQIQPKLLDSYNKRINTFMRKMQQNPIVLERYDQNEFAHHKLFRNFQNKQKLLGSQFFRFKDHNDWSSIYTEAERSERKMNEKVMKEKFGDGSLAYRSIGSQSQYTPSSKHEYRFRQKEKQINPPMKYVFSIPQIMMKKMNDKKLSDKLKTQGNQNDKKKSQLKQTKQSQHQRSKHNKSGVSRTTHFIDNQDNKSVRSFKSIQSFADSIISKKTNQSQDGQPCQNQQQKKQKEKKKFMSPKMHFKTLIQSFEQTSDRKTKQNMREILIKCGIFRHKDKRALPDIQIDKLSFQIDHYSLSGGTNGTHTQTNSQNNNNNPNFKINKIANNRNENKN